VEALPDARPGARAPEEIARSEDAA